VSRSDLYSPECAKALFDEPRPNGFLGSSAKVGSRESMPVAPEGSPRVPRVEKYSDRRSPSL
jgi:hypothetical protein